MEHQNTTEFEMRLSEQAVDALRESAKWSFFLAIMGFIGIAFLVICAIFIGTMYSAMDQMGGGSAVNPIMGAGSGIITAIYLLLAIVYFFPVYYLFKYASDTKAALNNRNSDMLTNGLTYLKSHHKFLGIFTIIMMSLYVLIIIGAFIFAAVAM